MKQALARLILASAACLLGPTLAAAQTIHGPGAHPCSTWTESRGNGGRDFDGEAWVLGYLSGVNTTLVTGPGIFKGLTDSSIFRQVDTYCRDHAGQMLWDAVKTIAATPHNS